MSEGAGLTFSFQGEGLVIPPKPTSCDGCDGDTRDILAELKAYRVILQPGVSVPQGQTHDAVCWWCDECLGFAPMQEELWVSITRLPIEGQTQKTIYAEGVWHLK